MFPIIVLLVMLHVIEVVRFVYKMNKKEWVYIYVSSRMWALRIEDEGYEREKRNWLKGIVRSRC